MKEKSPKNRKISPKKEPDLKNVTSFSSVLAINGVPMDLKGFGRDQFSIIPKITRQLQSNPGGAAQKSGATRNLRGRFNVNCEWPLREGRRRG